MKISIGRFQYVHFFLGFPSSTSGHSGSLAVCALACDYISSPSGSTTKCNSFTCNMMDTHRFWLSAITKKDLRVFALCHSAGCIDCLPITCDPFLLLFLPPNCHPAFPPTKIKICKCPMSFLYSSFKWHFISLIRCQQVQVLLYPLSISLQNI